MTKIYRDLHFCSLIVFAICLFTFHKALAQEEDEIPLSKISQNVGGPTLKILYCYSCGYRKMYDQYVKILGERYPEINVIGGNYDPPGFFMFLVRLIGALKMLVILCIIGGVNVFDYFNIPQPSWWRWCIENKIYASMMLFFISNLIEGQLIQSGAFEITLNNVPIWSKLESGRIPQPPELFQIIDSHRQFSGTESKIDLPKDLHGFAK